MSAKPMSVPEVAQHDSSDPTLKPPVPMDPRHPLLLESEMEPLTVAVPPISLMLAPELALLPAKVLLKTLAVPAASVNPPPDPPPALLPSTVLLSSTSVPLLKMPPPDLVPELRVFEATVVPTSLTALLLELT
jgi:hypothetical protein